MFLVTERILHRTATMLFRDPMRGRGVLPTVLAHDGLGEAGDGLSVCGHQTFLFFRR